MKILILSQSRSGSTTLVNALSKSTGIDIMFEPFHNDTVNLKSHQKNEFTRIVESENILVKIIDNHFYNFDSFANYKDLTKYFDKVIGLTRENDEKNAESYYVAKKTRIWRKYSGRPSVEIDKNSKEYLKILNESTKNRKEILSFDIFQVSYEGLYERMDQIEKLEEYLGFSIKEHIDFFKKAR